MEKKKENVKIKQNSIDWHRKGVHLDVSTP